MIRFQFTGNIGNDATIRQAGNSNAISFSVAHTTKYKDRKSGEWKSKTTWVKCTLWREDGKTKIAEYLTKGTKVYVEGEPIATAYLKGEEVVASLECRVITVEIMGAKSEKENTSHAEAASGDDDDLPF